VGAADLLADERFATNEGRVVHRPELSARLAERFRARPAAEWLAALEAAGVPCAPVQSVGEALRDPAFTGRNGVWEMEGDTYGRVPTIASPLRFSRTPASARRAAPALGEHTGQVARDGWGGGDREER
jgi:crotonobetainyl-CoA:carnitine CoA-transferase CaiB-like acyl-CoA transferase